MEAYATTPTSESFVSLAEHQASTPASFFLGPPVLHGHAPSATVIVSKEHLQEHELLKMLQKNDASQNGVEGSADLAITNVDIYVTSRSLILWAKETAKGISISYPSIALHALGAYDSAAIPGGSAQAVIMQLNLHDPELVNSDDEMQTLDLILLPESPQKTSSDSAEPTTPELPPVKALFEALSACADLHPDPQEPGDADSEEGEEEEDSIPGAGGWITAENMADYMDEDGNFAGFAGNLGPGAGTVRIRGGVDDAEISGDEDDDGKWRRTE